MLRLIVVATALASLAGCASLPPLPPRVASSAITDTRETALGRIAEASLSGAAPGESGFRALPSGDFAFDARLAIVRRAERSIDAQYYQLHNDSVGRQFLRELQQAARRGVRVRLLVDDLYTAGEDELFRTLAALPRVEVRLFNPLPSRGTTLLGRVLMSLHDFTRINHRMHNKLLVADSRFSVSGGRNLADEYFMRSARANFIDMDVLAAGPVVREQSAVFDRYWNSGHAWPVEAVVPLSFDVATAGRRFDELVAGDDPELAPEGLDPLGRPPVEAELAAGRAGLLFADAAVLADAPDKVGRREFDENVSTVSRSMLEAFADARFEVVIASPYFIPGKVGMASMKRAIDHGVRVVILTNGIGATDEPLVHWRYARYRRELLRLGVVIYELSPRLSRESGTFGDFRRSFGRLHAKVATIDRRRIFVGSLNFDARSAWSNTESGLLIESPTLAEGVRGLIAGDRGRSVYRLRLADDGDSIEWVATTGDGREVVTREEPDNDWLLRLKMFLLEPFAPEELL